MRGMDNGKYKLDLAFKSEVIVDGKKCGGSYLNPGDGRERGIVELLGLLDRFGLSENAWHEFLHDCEYAESIDLGTREQAEATIIAIAGYQCRLLRNNPRFAKFFIEGLNPAYTLSIKQGKSRPRASKKRGKHGR